MAEDQNPTSDTSTEPETVTVVGDVVSDGEYTLFVADFSDPDAAWAAYEDLKSIEDGQRVAIEGVVVVKKDAEGKLEVQKVTDHSTRSGLKWGIVGGVVLGVLFPPSIIGSAAALGVAGAAVGKARELHHRSELAQELEDVIEPGHSGILALVSDPGAIEIRKALDKADAIVEKAVDNVTANDIKAAARETQSTGDDSDATANG
ncbi:MAG TPA: DUF1269 domain-containing protein [Dermatophilaceae bacterium]